MDKMRPMQAPRRAAIEIGLLNNMPDAALHATERQFASLLKAAGGQNEVRLSFYSLPQIQRGELTRAYMDGIYGDAEALFGAGLDGLVVTGAEPRAANLREEPYWDALARVIDWAEGNVAASYWSCLAAHAAVLRLDSLQRTPLETKLSGVFENQHVGADPLLANLPTPARTPHSRLNGLDEQELADHGYQILTRSPEAGVDMFVRRGASLMLFGQGHPEYDADTLLREYCRDACRFLNGRRDTHPDIPSDYLNLKIQRSFAAVAARGRDPARMARYNAIAAAATPKQVWRSSAVVLFRNWLQHIAAAKARPANTAARGPLTARASAAARSRRS